jgi:DNA-binding NarL/FixJ family response regulator
MMPEPDARVFEQETRVLLAEDHALVREGLRELLDAQPGIRIIGEVSDGREAVAETLRLTPDVVVMDAWLPRLSGLLALTEIRKASPSTRVVMLSAYERVGFVVEALREGAYAYVPKSAPASELLAAIRAASAGEKYLSQAVSKQLVAQVIEPGQEGGQSIRWLTQREREILQRLAEGLSAKEIGAELDISVRTVESHRASMMRKLGVHKAADLVRFAIREGLVAP